MGAEIFGADLTQLDDDAFAQILQTFHDYGAVVIRNQQLTHDQHLEFAKRFGSVEIHPIVDGIDGFPEIIKIHKSAGDAATFGVGWHSDNSFTQNPSMGSVLYAKRSRPWAEIHCSQISIWPMNSCPLVCARCWTVCGPCIAPSMPTPLPPRRTSTKGRRRSATDIRISLRPRSFIPSCGHIRQPAARRCTSIRCSR